MNNTVTIKTVIKLVLDLPNILYNHKHRGEEQLDINFLAFMNFINYSDSLGTPCILLITPKLEKEYPERIGLLVNYVTNFTKTKGWQVIYSTRIDPDEEILDYSEQLKYPIISNDKFQQKKYNEFGIARSLVISFKIGKKCMFPISLTQNALKQFIDERIPELSH